MQIWAPPGCQVELATDAQAARAKGMLDGRAMAYGGRMPTTLVARDPALHCAVRCSLFGTQWVVSGGVSYARCAQSTLHCPFLSRSFSAIVLAKEAHKCTYT